MAQKLSVTIITKNEQDNITRCLNSVKWADEIVVVDSGSTDRSVEMCRDFGCRVIETEWLGFGRTKKLAVDAASNDWILSVDADEEISEELRNKIVDVLQHPDFNGYRIKRTSFYLGKMIRHCGWNRDYPLRLFNRRFGNFNEKIVHESVKLSGETGRIEEAIFHYTYPTIHSHIQRMNRYSELGAEQALLKHKSATIVGAVMRGALKFIKMYLFQFGFLDGKIGFILAYNSAFGVYLKYLKIWEKNR